MKNTFIIAVVLGVLVVAGGVWFFASSPEEATEAEIEEAFMPSVLEQGVGAAPPGAAAAPGGEVSGALEASTPDGYRVYTATAFRFSLAVPPELKAEEFKEGTNAMTVTFEDATGEKSFQIFVTPYSGSVVTKERFALDVPSGVMKEPLSVVIDGTTGTMFESTNIVMGDTREVWFIKNGFLYEVTTYKELDAWLSQIMTRWQFI